MPLGQGLGLGFVRPRPSQARPKPGLSGQARPATSLVGWYLLYDTRGYCWGESWPGDVEFVSQSIHHTPAQEDTREPGQGVIMLLVDLGVHSCAT